MRLIWMAAAALLAVAVAGCSGGESSEAAVTSSGESIPTGFEAAAPEADQHTEAQEGGVRIAVGETGPVFVPADAIMEIKAPAEWGDALSGLRCTVTDSTGRNEDLRSSDVKKRERIAGGEWVTLWTFSAQPATEVTVGCKDPGARVQGAGRHTVLVAARGTIPVPNPAPIPSAPEPNPAAVPNVAPVPNPAPVPN
ncbi:hypothetical protein [Nocardia bovistercoris]|uniref:Uncharacterized protein n=1 Tax=Nocardia bovistercoris TaxID=2785916 RepID=A0A931MYZ3_9NOCA|nr:hypothetical protein [Nocardia bovistercoris]MBH0775580.1 hypothetical protein [Nocardia bovistercoris]